MHYERPYFAVRASENIPRHTEGWDVDGNTALQQACHGEV